MCTKCILEKFIYYFVIKLKVYESITSIPFLLHLQEYFDSKTASCPARGSSVSTATGPKCVKSGLHNSLKKYTFVYFILSVYYFQNQKMENIVIRMKNIYVMNTIKANISSIWKSYSNYFYAILVLPWEYIYIKFPTIMHSDNRQSRVTYEDLHVLKCNNDSNVYILKYFRIFLKKSIC